MGYFGKVSAAGMTAYLADGELHGGYDCSHEEPCYKFVFASLTVLFFLLAAGEFNLTVRLLGGYVRLIC